MLFKPLKIDTIMHLNIIKYFLNFLHLVQRICNKIFVIRRSSLLTANYYLGT